MAIYHMEAKVISRGAGRSAVAAAAYMSCSKIMNDHDGVTHDYTPKGGLVWQETFLPEYAPAEWQDRAVLWNAVEEAEKTKDSRLAREFVVALPVELDREQWQALLTEFIQNQFVVGGMCADVAIHDADGHNPHAHILLTVRPLNENGTWQNKTEKEYLCVRDREERGFTAAEFLSAQRDGWEKQYRYLVGKKKVYMTPSAADAHGYERISKYPKSTKYGRQNPISERWNSDEQLLLWRAAWAEINNRYLEQAGREERIDHRSHADRGLDEQPTVHEGVAARAMEQQGIVSDRCELNRQIKADNALLRELKAAVKKLAQAVKNTIPAIAEAMESLRGKMIIFRYQLRRTDAGKWLLHHHLDSMKPELEHYTGLVGQIKEKSKERKTALAEKKDTPIWNISRHRDLARRIAELTEELEELRTQKNMVLNTLDCADDSGVAVVRKDIATMEAALEKLKQQEVQYAAELDAALKEYAELQAQAAEFDLDELTDARLSIRPDKECDAQRRIQSAYGDKYDPLMMLDSKRDVAAMLHEESEERRSVREQLRRQEQKRQSQPQHRKRRDNLER